MPSRRLSKGRVPQRKQALDPEAGWLSLAPFRRPARMGRDPTTASLTQSSVCTRGTPASSPRRGWRLSVDRAPTLASDFVDRAFQRFRGCNRQYLFAHRTPTGQAGNIQGLFVGWAPLAAGSGTSILGGAAAC
jgi:hypothetical protein